MATTRRLRRRTARTQNVQSFSGLYQNCLQFFYFTNWKTTLQVGGPQIFYKSRPPHQCPRCWKGYMKHASYRRLACIKHHHRKFGCPNYLVPGICYPCQSSHCNFAGINWHLEGKCAWNGSICFSVVGWGGFWLSTLHGAGTCFRS